MVPTIQEYQARTGKLPKRLLFSLAALIRFYKGEWNGNPIPLQDTADVVNFFSDAWKNEKEENFVEKILSNKTLWGSDLTQVQGLTAAVKTNLKYFQEGALTKIEELAQQ